MLIVCTCVPLCVIVFKRDRKVRLTMNVGLLKNVTPNGSLENVTPAYTVKMKVALKVFLGMSVNFPPVLPVV